MRLANFRTSIVTVVGAAFVVLLPACHQKKLPSAPSELSTGVTIYIDRDFQGISAHITSDISNFEDYDGPCPHDSTSGGIVATTTTHYNWGDCMSSIKVAPGWRATIYREDSFKGEYFEVTADVADLTRLPGSCSKGGLNDCISSIRVSAK